MMADERYRLNYSVRLDMGKQDDVEVADLIELLKNERNFVPTVRAALRLITTLRRGDTSVLFELFPWLEDRILPPATRQLTRADRDDMLELLRLYDEYRRQSSAYAEDSDERVDIAPARSFTATAKIKSIEHVRVTKPLHDDFDDDDIEIDIHKDTRTDSAANFLKSLEALQG